MKLGQGGAGRPRWNSRCHVVTGAQWAGCPRHRAGQPQAKAQAGVAPGVTRRAGAWSEGRGGGGSLSGGGGHGNGSNDGDTGPRAGAGGPPAVRAATPSPCRCSGGQWRGAAAGGGGAERRGRAQPSQQRGHFGCSRPTTSVGTAAQWGTDPRPGRGHPRSPLPGVRVHPYGVCSHGPCLAARAGGGPPCEAQRDCCQHHLDACVAGMKFMSRCAMLTMTIAFPAIPPGSERPSARIDPAPRPPTAADRSVGAPMYGAHTRRFVLNSWF